MTEDLNYIPRLQQKYNEVIQKALDFAKLNAVPINSLEGFIRQIIGWREFIRVYTITKVKKNKLLIFGNMIVN